MEIEIKEERERESCKLVLRRNEGAAKVLYE